MQTIREKTAKKPITLLVDDDKMVLNIGVKILQRLGYVVLEAQSGQEAIKIFEENQSRVDLVILDMRMPDMNGDAVFEQLRQINSRVKVLIASGYMEDSRIGNLITLGCNGFIQKPFRASELLQEINKILVKRKSSH
jgi:two-component system cell cycle sensor histidine kinase/response regulator CckA